MIKNIIFDIGRVLIDFEWDKYIRRLFNDETADKVTAALWGTGYWKELDKALLTDDEILELFYSAGPDVRDEIREAFDRVGECVMRRDWAIPVIEDLKSRGYRVLYLSNFSEHVMDSNPEALDFIPHMDGGIFSCDVKVIKPAPEIFSKLIDKYGLIPEECLFVDDHMDNTAMGRKFGMKTILFRNAEQFYADLDKTLVKDRGHDKITVLCYGDSNTYGYDPQTGSRYPYEKRWTSILSEKLGGRYEVIPEGLNGRTTAFDRAGADWKNGARSIISCLGTHKPVDYLILMAGTNDCNKEMGLSAEEIARGMEELVTLTEEKTPELQGYIPEIIVAVPAAIQGDVENSPFADKITEESARKSKDLVPLYCDIANRHMVRFANAADCAEVSSYDCEHLTENGHRQMAELFFNVITCDPFAYDVEQKLVP